MPYDIDTDRQWKREQIPGHGDATAEVRDLLSGDYKKITTVGWISDSDDSEAEMARIFSENVRSIEGLSASGDFIVTGADAWEKGSPRLNQAIVRMLVVRSSLHPDDLGKS